MNEAKLRWQIVIRISRKLKTGFYKAKLRYTFILTKTTRAFRLEITYVVMFKPISSSIFSACRFNSSSILIAIDFGTKSPSFSQEFEYKKNCQRQMPTGQVLLLFLQWNRKTSRLCSCYFTKMLVPIFLKWQCPPIDSVTCSRTLPSTPTFCASLGRFLH